jgi:hypothetical protein
LASLTSVAVMLTVRPWSVCADMGVTVTEIGGAAELEHPAINAAADNAIDATANKRAGRIFIPLPRRDRNGQS